MASTFMLDKELQDELDTILEEVGAEVEISTSIERTENRVKVTKERLQTAAESIYADECLPEETRTDVKKVVIEKCSALIPSLMFIEECFAAAQCKTVNTSRDKACQEFQKRLPDALVNLSRVTEDYMISNVLCLNLFERMLSEMYESCDAKKVVNDVLDEEKRIVKYIGGSVVKKIKQRMYSVKDSENMLLCLDMLCAEKDGQPTTDGQTDSYDSGRVEERQMTGDMTMDLDRGGLTEITTEAWDMFLQLEYLFRDVTGFSDFAISNTESEFLKRCDTDVASHFSDAIDLSKISQQTRQETFDKIIKLYFKIRINHKCRQFINKVKTQWREKAFRKTLGNKS